MYSVQKRVGSLPLDIFYLPIYYRSSDEWRRVPKKEKEEMKLKVADDGEFWYATFSSIFISFKLQLLYVTVSEKT